MMGLLICLQLFYFICLLPSHWKMFILTVKFSESSPIGLGASLRILGRDDMDRLRPLTLLNFSVCFAFARLFATKKTNLPNYFLR